MICLLKFLDVNELGRFLNIPTKGDLIFLNKNKQIITYVAPDVGQRHHSS